MNTEHYVIAKLCEETIPRFKYTAVCNRCCSFANELFRHLKCSVEKKKKKIKKAKKGSFYGESRPTSYQTVYEARLRAIISCWSRVTGQKYCRKYEDVCTTNVPDGIVIIKC